MVNLDPAFGLVGHDLQNARRPAHQADTHQFKAQALNHGLDDVRKAAVHGSFGNKIRHSGSRNKKRATEARRDFR